MSGDPIYNVVVTVIDLIPAASPEEAISKLADRLDYAGFATHVDGDDTQGAFESEPVDDEPQIRADWQVIRRLPDGFCGPTTRRGAQW